MRHRAHFHEFIFESGLQWSSFHLFKKRQQTRRKKKKQKNKTADLQKTTCLARLTTCHKRVWFSTSFQTSAQLHLGVLSLTLSRTSAPSLLPLNPFKMQVCARTFSAHRKIHAVQKIQQTRKWIRQMIYIDIHNTCVTSLPIRTMPVS